MLENSAVYIIYHNTFTRARQYFHPRGGLPWGGLPCLSGPPLTYNPRTRVTPSPISCLWMAAAQNHVSTLIRDQIWMIMKWKIFKLSSNYKPRFGLTTSKRTLTICVFFFIIRQLVLYCLFVSNCTKANIFLLLVFSISCCLLELIKVSLR